MGEGRLLAPAPSMLKMWPPRFWAASACTAARVHSSVPSRFVCTTSVICSGLASRKLCAASKPYGIWELPQSMLSRPSVRRHSGHAECSSLRGHHSWEMSAPLPPCAAAETRHAELGCRTDARPEATQQSCLSCIGLACNPPDVPWCRAVAEHLEAAAVAGVVDPDVHRAHLGGGRAHQALHAGRAADVALDARHPRHASHLRRHRAPRQRPVNPAAGRSMGRTRQEPSVPASPS